MIWIVRTRCVTGGTGREWIHLVRCDGEGEAAGIVQAELGIPWIALDIQAKKCESFIRMAEIESRVWNYTK